MKKHATLSACGTYRYWLERSWAECGDKRPGGGHYEKGFLNFVMLNPSVADAERDDPTIRKCIGFAQRWGYIGIHVVNLFAFRATNPAVLKTAKDPIGPDNHEFIRASVLSADLTVVAWGKMGSWMNRAVDVYRGLLDESLTVALRTNGDGSPEHPLYVPYDVQPVKWAPGASA